MCLFSESTVEMGDAGRLPPAALARLFHSVGAKVILASRNVQQLQRLKFELDNNHIQKVSKTKSTITAFNEC